VSSIVRLRFDAPRHTRATGKNRPLTTFSGLGLAAPILQALDTSQGHTHRSCRRRSPVHRPDRNRQDRSMVRAGPRGIAISLCHADERGQLRAIDRLIRRSIPAEDRQIQRVACPMTPWPIPSRTGATTAAAGAPMAGGDNKNLQVERGVGLHTLPGLARGPGFGSHRPAAGPRRHSPQRADRNQDRVSTRIPSTPEGEQVQLSGSGLTAPPRRGDTDGASQVQGRSAR
jgi:hypothetical protein